LRWEGLDLFNIVLIIIAAVAIISIAITYIKLKFDRDFIKKITVKKLNLKNNESEFIDYGLYKMKPIEYVIALLLAAAVLLLIGYIF
jgi:hypothetical protein